MLDRCNKCLKKVELPIYPHMCAPISEVPSYICTIAGTNIEACYLKGQGPTPPPPPSPLLLAAPCDQKKTRPVEDINKTSKPS